MNDRERFLATMHYQPRDRSPIMDFTFWDETIVIWHEQGLPEYVDRTNSDEYFGMDGRTRFSISRSPKSRAGFSFSRDEIIGRGIEVGLMPSFEEKVIEDRGDYEVIQQSDGVRVLRKKFMSSIPSHEGHLLVDRESWLKHYKPRLNPDDPDRFPNDWDDCVKRWSDPNRSYPLFLPGGSLYGWIRNWMGLEAVSCVIYDDPAWFEEMVETVADCALGVLQRVLSSGVRFDACAMWEDMCYNAGPLISPAHFKRYLVPHYKRFTELLHKHGVDIIWVDSDGDVKQLLPLWLEAGVNCMFPLEIGNWGADPIQYRKEYGKDLLIMGAFDKHILARSKGEIENEVKRLSPLVEEGGYIGYCDHLVPPDVPLKNYLFYLSRVREIWGHNINLKPIHAEIEKLM